MCRFQSHWRKRKITTIVQGKQRNLRQSIFDNIEIVRIVVIQ